MNTYLLAPNWTFAPGGPIRIGNIILDPHEPQRSLSRVDPSLPTPEIVTTTEPGRSTFRSPGCRSLDGSVWATLLPRAKDKSSAEVRDVPTPYAMDSLETVSLQYAPTEDDVSRRMQNKTVQAAMHTSFRRKRPVYMITGLKIAKGSGLKEESGHHDFVFAYQLYVIAEHGWLRKSISISVYTPQYEFFKETEILDKRQIITCSFRSLQLTCIESLQRSLLKLHIEATRHGSELPETLVQQIASTLSAYGNAIRDYEMLSLNAAREIPKGAIFAGDLDLVSGDIEARLRQSQMTPWMLRNLGLFKSPHDSEARSDLGLQGSADLKSFLGLLGYRELDTVGRQFRAERKAYTERLVMGLFGGLALIGPMLIMVLKPSRNASLITVSIATILFSLVLAEFGRDSAGKDVLAATAAYAAVLVVFVGASGNSSP